MIRYSSDRRNLSITCWAETDFFP